MRVALLLLALINTGCVNSFFYKPVEGSSFPETNSAKQELFIESSPNRLHSVFIPSEVITKRGLILHLHGNAGNISETYEKYGWVTKEGFDLLLFDYSGYGYSTGEPNTEQLHKDAQAIYDYVVKNATEHHEEYTHIVIGTSLGGAVLLHSLSTSEHRDFFDLIVVDSTFYSYRSVARHVLTHEPMGSLYAWVANLFVPKNRFDPYSNLAHFNHTPMLFVHCLADKLIPWQHTKQLYDKVKAPKNLILLPNCGHARSFTPESAGNRKQLIQLLTQHETNNF